MLFLAPATSTCQKLQDGLPRTSGTCTNYQYCLVINRLKIRVLKRQGESNSLQAFVLKEGSY